MEERQIKNFLRSQVSTRIEHKQKFDKESLKSLLEKILEEQQSKNNINVSSELKDKIISSLVADLLGWGPLEEIMKDEEVSEIMINGPYDIYVEKNSQKVKTALKFDDEKHLHYIIEKMLQRSGRHLDSFSPYVDLSLDDGSRVNIVIPPVAYGKSYVTIRKFSHRIKTVDDLVAKKTLDRRMADFLVACIRGGINILFSGATGVGKTTTLEVLSSYIPDEERIVVIEDTPEIQIKKDDVARMIARPSNLEGKGEISIRDLFMNSLRMRPQRIILGEIRGKEALDYLQALNSGHHGSLAVIHASSAYNAVGRLEILALYSGLNLPGWVIRKQIASGLDLVVQQEQLADGVRRIVEISEISGIDNEYNIQMNTIFSFQQKGYSGAGKLEGRFLASGKLPVFYEKLLQKGINLEKDIFRKDEEE